MTLVDDLQQTKDLTFTLRAAEMDDLDAVVATINDAGLAQTGGALTNEQQILDDWKLESFRLESATRVAEMEDGRIAGYIEVWDLDPIPVQNWVWARVHPQFEGVGIGSALMDWAEKRLQITARRVPDDLRVTFISAAPSAHTATKALFEDRNMKRVRRLWHMMIKFDGAPPQPVWPEGITLSSFAQRDDLAAIVRADQEAFRDHWGHVPQPLDELVEEYREWIDGNSGFDSGIWILAMDGEEIAGICLCTRERAEYPGAAWINTLGVRRPWRRQGLGLALLHHAFGIFYREGKEGVGLGVDSANVSGATRLYERAGMSVVKEDDAYEKEIRPGRDLANKG